jgi:hypothetical protein
MKGQISFVEFLVTTAVFISFIGYFSFQLINFYPLYLNEIRNERIRSEAYQISEILANDPRLGLSDETKNKTNLLSMNKINEIGDGTDLCKPGYDTVKERLGSAYDFSIALTRKIPSEMILINCHPPSSPLKAINITVRRIVSFDSSYGELIIQMW